MFTDKFISSNGARQDMRFVLLYRPGPIQVDIHVDTYYNRFTYIDYIPVVGIISGLTKILFGSIHALGYTTLYFYKNDNKERNYIEIQLGIKNVVKGCILMLPVIGNIIVYLGDMYKINQAIQQIREKCPIRPNRAILYEHGQETGQHTIEEYEQLLNHKLPAKECLQHLRHGRVNDDDQPFLGISLVRD